jgi:hypothetical protein
MNNPFVDNRFKNEHTGLQQTWLPCTITSISATSNYTKRKDEAGVVMPEDAQTPFRRCVVEVTIPNVGVKVIDANLWYASLEANDIVFVVGGECAATFDLEGDYAGSVWLNLPPKRNIDLSWFGVAPAAPANEADEIAALKAKLAEAEAMKQ